MFKIIIIISVILSKNIFSLNLDQKYLIKLNLLNYLEHNFWKEENLNQVKSLWRKKIKIREEN